MKLKLDEEFFANLHEPEYPEKESEFTGVMDSTYKSTRDNAKRTLKDIKDRFKDHDEMVKEFLKRNHDRNFNVKIAEFRSLKLDESLESKQEEYVDTDEKIVVYPNKRDCLGDLIQVELTSGEEVYLYDKKNDTFTQTNLPGKGLDDTLFGVQDINGNKDCLKYTSENNDENEIKAVEEVAKKYGKDVIKGGFAGKNNKLWIAIKLTSDDWNKPYEDPNVITRKKIVQMKKEEKKSN